MPMIGRLGGGSIRAFEPPSRFTKIRDDVYRFYQRPIVHPNSIPYGEYAYLPKFFYLQYIIALARGNQYVTAACVKDDAVGRISTSSYSLRGNTSLGLGSTNNWGYNGGATNTPDDYDSTWIDGAGYHYLVSGPTNTLNPSISSQTAGQMWRWKVNENNAYYYTGTATNTPGFKSDNVIQVGLPAIKKTLFFNQTYYYFYDHITGTTTSNINWTGLDSDASTILTTLLSGLSTGTSPANKFRWVSDGINSLWFTSVMNVATGSTYGTSGVGYLYFDLSTSSPTVEFSKSYNVTGVTTSWTGAVGYGGGNTSMTEEDCNGDGLYTIDGSISYIRNNTFYFGTSSLTTRPSMFSDWSPGSLSSATVGTNDSQQGSDVLGPICTDNIVTIADNGHDDGGIFAYGTADAAVVWARTNIELLTVPPSALGGSSATAASTVAEIAATGQRGKGYFYINTPNGGIKKVWCDFDTVDENGNTGWMLVASWASGSQWTTNTSSSSNIVGPGNLTYGWSSNFGDYTINQFRITAHWNAQDALGPASAGQDWYYNYTTSLKWKEVWSWGSGTNKNYINDTSGTSDGNINATFHSGFAAPTSANGSVPRVCLRGFNWAYNLKHSYKASTQNWANLSDGGGSGTTQSYPDWWGGLTTSGVTLGVYSYPGGGDGSLAIIPSGTTYTTAGQDCTANQSKVGYDDTSQCYYYGATSTASAGDGAQNTGSDYPLYFWIR